MDSYTLHISRRLARYAVVALVTATVVVPATALATHLFDDVTDGSTHAEGIGYVADKGITVGCDANSYCPEDPVTRAQMATFLYRSSGNDPATDPSVNAALIAGLEAGEITRLAYRERSSSAAPIASGQTLQTTVRPPADGLVLVTANILATGDGTTADAAFCGLEVDDSGTFVETTVGVASDTSGFFAGQCVSHGVIPLTAGTHEVALLVDSFVGSAEFLQGTMSALFVPFDANGDPLAALSVGDGMSMEELKAQFTDRFPGEG